MTNAITLLVGRLSSGDEAAAKDLFPLVYEELRRLAGNYMRGERADHTLQSTALVHEAFVRLAGGEAGARCEGREHFFRVAAKAMRGVLVDHARSKNADKRGGGAGERVTLSEAVAELGDGASRLLDVDEALESLAGFDDELARIVELRFFGGLTCEEAARALAMPLRTVERGWRTARAYLQRRLAGHESSG